MNANIVSETFNLQRAKDEIYRSVSRKKKGDNSVHKVGYTNVEYVDPNFVKISKLERPPRNYEAYNEMSLERGRGGK